MSDLDLDSLRADLARWFGRCGRDLPFRREDRTPWGVLVCEIMAHQTPMSRVVPAWERWMERWPTPAATAQASPGDVVRMWGTLGYPRRALRLHEAAATIAADPVLAPLAVAPYARAHDLAPGDIVERLLALPGVGPYTAAAVAAFGCGKRALVLDTNVRRVLARLVGGTDQPASTPTRAERERAQRVWPDDDALAVAWAAHVMELGALVCRARTPECRECPVSAHCRWLARGAPRRATPLSRQRYTGTDRQARGRVLALLRAHPEAQPVATALAAARLPGAEDTDQAERALAGLIADGLVVRDGAMVGLPS